ncbi:MAG: hypothetical protein ABIE22_04740, partial [archaeon]
MAKGTVLTLSDLYADSSLYTNVEASVPPAELKDNVIVFEAETGCKYQRCTYCMIYDGVRYSPKSLEQFNANVDKVWGRVDPSLAMDFTRQFVTGGNVLGFKTDKLEKMVEHLERRFYENTDRYPERTALYGRTDSILMQGKEGLGRINCGNLGYGVNLIFWGLESGSTKVLDYVRKGYTQ